MIHQPVTVYGGKYRFVLAEDYALDLDMGWTGEHVFCDAGRTFATLNGSVMTIFAGYAFDGSSPAFKICGKWFGTPTPDSVVAAALVHDCLRQFMPLDCVPYNRKDTDDCFFNIMRANGWKATSIYHGAVAGIFGTIFIRLTNKSTTISCNGRVPN